jgi:hypothetical protein
MACGQAAQMMRSMRIKCWHRLAVSRTRDRNWKRRMPRSPSWRSGTAARSASWSSQPALGRRECLVQPAFNQRSTSVQLAFHQRSTRETPSERIDPTMVNRPPKWCVNRAIRYCAHHGQENHANQYCSHTFQQCSHNRSERTAEIVVPERMISL